MRAHGAGLLRAAGSSRAARGLLLAFLACSLVSRLADANPHPDLWYTVAVALCYVLPAWLASGRRPTAWERRPLLLLGAQAAVSYVPLLAFGAHWVGGVDGLLGGMALVLLRRPLAWWVFGALWATELGAWFIVGLPYEPAANAAVWLLVAYGTVGLGYFGLSDAVRLLERLESTAEALADAAVDRERLATAEGLQATIMRRLADIQSEASAALSAGSARATAQHLRLVGEAAREAAASARRILTVIPEPTRGRFGDPAATPTLARRVVLAVALLYGLQFISAATVPLRGGASPLLLGVIAIAVVAVMVVLQVRHSRIEQFRPAGWQWTLAAQGVLTLALYPVFGVVSIGIPLFCGSALLLLPSRWRWAVVVAVLATIPPFALLASRDPTISEIAVQWSLYATATFTAATLVVYGLGRFVQVTAQLADARERLAETAATRERVRIARDTHDTLGLALSAIALKSDLAQALLTRDEPRARREIAQTIHLSRTVAADAESIVNGNLRLHLGTELAAAHDALDAARIRVRIERGRLPVDDDVETQLAAILREAIANVLRHSDARSCSIRVGEDDSGITVEVVNDGVHDPRPEGRGLANIRERVVALGGELVAGSDGGSFTVSARLPATTRTAARA